MPAASVLVVPVSFGPTPPPNLIVSATPTTTIVVPKTKAKIVVEMFEN